MCRFSFIILFLLSSYSAICSTPMGIERINFFPDSKSYLTIGLSHQNLNIETPQETLQTKEVNNYTNLLHLSYAYRFGRKIFVGLGGGFEEASENAAVYAIPLRRRFTSSGFTDPEIFTTYRLRHQKNNRGNIDAFLSYSPALGPREISSTDTTRFSGRNTLSLALSLGFLEDKWEFRNRFSGTYFSEGRENNHFNNDSTFVLENYFQISYAFTTQYELASTWYLSGSVSINYNSNQIMRMKDEEKRELRSGTGSVFGLGIKKTLSTKSMLEFSYNLKRSEYFVKAESFNLDGDQTIHDFILNCTLLF